MNRSRLLLSSFALSGLVASAGAQTIDITINTGSSWTLNSSSSVAQSQDLACDFPGAGGSCQVSDGQCAQVDWEIDLTQGLNSPAYVYAKYTGSNHAGCVLGPVSATGSASGHVDFVHSGSGSFDFDLWSHAVANDTYAHTDGDANAYFTITLHSTWVPSPPLVKPPFHLVLSNSAHVTGGPGSGTISDWTRTTATKTNRDYLSVDVDVDGDAYAGLPSALINNPGVLGSVSAIPNSNSFINLN